MVDYQPYVDEGAFALDTAEAFFMPDDPYGDDWFNSPPPDLDYTPEDDPWLPVDDGFVPTDAAPQVDVPPPGQEIAQPDAFVGRDEPFLLQAHIAAFLDRLVQAGMTRIYAPLNSAT